MHHEHMFSWRLCPKNKKKINKIVGVAMRMRWAFNCLHDVHHLNYAQCRRRRRWKALLWWNNVSIAWMQTTLFSKWKKKMNSCWSAKKKRKEERLCWVKLSKINVHISTSLSPARIIWVESDENYSARSHISNTLNIWLAIKMIVFAERLFDEKPFCV